MEQLTVTNQMTLSESRITSVQLAEVINTYRKEENNQSELLHKNLMAKIKKELETLKTLGLDNGLNFQLVEYKDVKGELRPCYSLNRDGALIILNSESTYVRFKTVEYINKLEARVVKQDSYLIDNPIERAKRWIEEQEQAQLRLAEKQLVIETQQAEIEEMKPKSIYCDKILKCSNLTVIRDIAKDYGYSSQKFNILLKDFGIQYKTQGKNGKWCPTAEYQDKGIMKTETYDINNNYAKVTYKWTQQGRLFLYEFLKDRDILPVCERMELEQLEEV